MLNHRGFSAWITVEDESLPEYLVAVDDEAHRVSCWIAGGEGKNFTVWWNDHGGKVDTCSFISLDGLLVPGRFLLGEGTASRSGVRSDQFKERPFTFLSVPEDTDVTTSHEANPDVGTIVLKIKRIDRVSSQHANAIQPLPPTTTIPRKRKAGDLGIGLGPEQNAPIQYPLTWDVVPHDTDRAPGKKAIPTFVSFVFRYRTQEFLEAQGIAPSPVKKRVIPTRVSTSTPASSSSTPQSGAKRRIDSLTASSSAHTALVTPNPAPPKRSRPSVPAPVHSDQAALGLGPTRARPSSDLRRSSSSSYYRGHTASGSSVPELRGGRTPTPSSSAFTTVVKNEPLEDQRPHLANQTVFLLPRTEAHQRVASGMSQRASSHSSSTPAPAASASSSASTSRAPSYTADASGGGSNAFAFGGMDVSMGFDFDSSSFPTMAEGHMMPFGYSPYPSPGLYLPGVLPPSVPPSRRSSGSLSGAIGPVPIASAPSMSAWSDVTTPGGSEEGESVQEAARKREDERSGRRPSLGGRISYG